MKRFMTGRWEDLIIASYGGGDGLANIPIIQINSAKAFEQESNLNHSLKSGRVLLVGSPDYDLEQTGSEFSPIEHQDLEYVKDCLTAWFKRWEEAIWWKLLSQSEKNRGFYVEHTIEGLLRGDINSRYKAYQISLGNNNNPGFMTINEVRSLENLNPVDGGDELFSPQNEPEPEPEPELPIEEPKDEELQPDS